MNWITGNILDQRRGIIAHQVNCQLVMGAGLAKQIREKYPRAFTQYRDIYGKIPIAKRLGKAQIVEVIKPVLYIANLFGQYNYLPRKIVHTDYPALTIALRQLRRWRDNIKGPNFPIYIPYGMGCGLAGGQWTVVNGILNDVMPEATIVKLPPKFNK
jgi:O-acetyl-ADP-ribose deacetylase (regulator of RNase III)